MPVTAQDGLQQSERGNTEKKREPGKEVTE
jgi:hypothetical protein